MQWRLTAAGVALVLGCGIPLTIDNIQADARLQAQAAADYAHQNELTAARLLPRTPPDVVWAVVKLIAEDHPYLCLIFSPAAGKQLARSVGAPSCLAATHVLAERVTDVNTYVTGLAVPQSAWSERGETAFVDGCAVNWDNALFGDPPITPPGPLPGRLGLTRQFHIGWLITSYQAC